MSLVRSCQHSFGCQIASVPATARPALAHQPLGESIGSGTNHLQSCTEWRVASGWVMGGREHVGIAITRKRGGTAEMGPGERGDIEPAGFHSTGQQQRARAYINSFPRCHTTRTVPDSGRPVLQRRTGHAHACGSSSTSRLHATRPGGRCARWRCPCSAVHAGA